MSQIEITASRPNIPVAMARPQLWSRQSGLNDSIGWLLMAVVALAPIPLGSNRGFFWALTAVAVGAIGIYYALRLGRLGESFRYRLSAMPLSTGLVILLGIYLAVQTIPVSWLGPLGSQIATYLAVTTPAGDVVSPQTISLAPGATWLMLLRLATYAVFYVLMLQITTNHRRKAFILNAALVIVTAYAIYGLVSLLQLGDTILGLPKWAYQGSATATFVNRNSFATFLAFGAVIAMALAVSKLGRADPDADARSSSFDPMALLHLVAYAIILTALYATQSRMGLAAALTSSGVVLILGLARTQGGLARVLALLVLFALAAALGLVVYGQGLLERLGSVEQSADVRLDLYTQVVDMIMARPWLGYGGGTFELVFPLFHQAPVSPDMVWDRAHNSYLSLWAELGLLAGSIPIILLTAAGVKIVSRLGHAQPDWTAKVAALGVLIVGAAHSLVDFSLEIQANTLMFVAILATGVAGVARRGHQSG